MYRLLSPVYHDTYFETGESRVRWGGVGSLKVTPSDDPKTELSVRQIRTSSRTTPLDTLTTQNYRSLILSVYNFATKDTSILLQFPLPGRWTTLLLPAPGSPFTTSQSFVDLYPGLYSLRVESFPV